MKPKAALPYTPADYEPADVTAIQAMHRGDASPDLQRRALNFIINDLARTYDLSYRPDSERDTAFAEGKRFVGLQLVKFLKLNTEAIRQAKQK
jgi:hypothetical protein